MNKKLSEIFKPNIRFYFMLLVLFAALTFFFGSDYHILAICEAVLIIILAVYTQYSSKKRTARIFEYIESVTNNMDSATRDTLVNFPLPVVIFNLNDNSVIWSNGKFFKMTGEKERLFDVRITDLFPQFSGKWLMDGKEEYPDLILINGKKYKVYGSMLRTEREPGSYNYIATTYWVDVTDYEAIRDKFLATRPVTAIIMLDNYDDLLKNMSEKDKSAMLSVIDDKVSTWAGRCGGYLCKYDRDRYLLQMEETALDGFIEEKFSILDSVRETANTSGIQGTLSIGIGKDGLTPEENYHFATLGIEMALSRGGDQAVIKDRFNFEFFGGRSPEVEKSTKVKTRVMANALRELIKDASTIFIMGHKFADLDTVGAAVGICCIANAYDKRARIVIDAEKNFASNLINLVSQTPEYKNVFISAQEALLEADSNCLLVVVDTNRPEQVESDALLFSCNHIAVIDHHRRAAKYIENATFNFHEPYTSSASELVTEMVQYLVDQKSIMRVEAEALLTGIVLDTKSFAIRTGSRTFDAAAFLRRTGADTSEVKRLMQSDFKTAMARYSIIQGSTIYREGIAIASSDTPENRVIVAQAADELLNIAGVETSFVVCPDGDAIFVSGRSIGKINVQVILEKLGGGGNQSTAGVQLKGTDIKAVIQQLTAAIDDFVDED